MSIPARRDSDPDLVIAEALRLQAARLSEVEGALRGLMDAVMPALQNSFPKSVWAPAWERAERALLSPSVPRARTHGGRRVVPETMAFVCSCGEREEIILELPGAVKLALYLDFRRAHTGPGHEVRPEGKQ